MTVVKATYGVYVDWNNDGDFGDAGEDLSTIFSSASIQRGFNDSLSRMVTVGRTTARFNNEDKSLSPPLEAAVLPRRPMKLEMTYGGSTVALFTGFTDAIEADAGERGGRMVTIENLDSVAKLDQDKGPIALLTHTTADAVIAAAVSATFTPSGTDYDIGINSFPFSSDRWEHDLASNTRAGTSYIKKERASDKILAACTADWGYFYIAKDGTPTFRNRHATSLDTSVELALDNTMGAMNYRKSAAPIYNVIEVTCYPRSIGEVYEVLSRLDQHAAPMIEESGTVTFELWFKDPSNQGLSIGGKDVITPVATTDFTCTSDEAGEGDDETGSVTVTDCSKYGDHIKIKLTNAAAYLVYVQLLQVRGYAVRTAGPITVSAEDATSIDDYGRRLLPIDAPLMGSAVDAQNLCDWLLSYYKDPQDEVRGVQFWANNSATLLEAARDLELLDRVVISEDQTGLSGYTGYITNITHDIQPGRIHSVTLDLATAFAYSADPFTLDSSLLDGPDVLIY